MRERWEGVESLGAYEDELRLTRPFLLGSAFFRIASRALVDYHLERGGMPRYMMRLG